MRTMVGFDVAKNTVVGTLLDERCNVLAAPETMTNTEEALCQWLKGILASSSPSSSGIPSAVCCESSSYYHHTIVRACEKLLIPCRVLNPIVTKQAIKATIRGKKTDPSDAVLIARLGLRGEGMLTRSQDVCNTAKTLLRSSTKLQAIAQSLRLMQQSILERRVPLDSRTAQEYQACIRCIETLMTRFRDTAISAVNPNRLRLLTSIPGVGRQTAAVICAELGDIARFSSVDKLVAFTGFDPRVRQSGTTLRRNTKLTKRGSSSLRRAVFLAANVSRQYDHELHEYYWRKRIEGRTHTEAMMPVCRKLITRIYKTLKTQTLYETHRLKNKG